MWIPLHKGSILAVVITCLFVGVAASVGLLQSGPRERGQVLYYPLAPREIHGFNGLIRVPLTMKSQHDVLARLKQTPYVSVTSTFHFHKRDVLAVAFDEFSGRLALSFIFYARIGKVWSYVGIAPGVDIRYHNLRNLRVTVAGMSLSATVDRGKAVLIPFRGFDEAVRKIDGSQ